MDGIHNSKELSAYWQNRYLEDRTGWDIGYPSEPIVKYFEQVENSDLKILIPGAGNAYEAEYLWKNGFTNATVLDIASKPLQNIKKRTPSFPDSNLIQENFFEHEGQYDIIVEQTFFCSFEPSNENRQAYANQMHSLLKKNGKLIGLWFRHELDLTKGRPYGGSQEEIEGYLMPYFTIEVFEECYNSIPPRMGNELFGIFKRRDE